MTAPLQPADVRAFWDYMTAHYGTSVLNKQDALEMRLVARLLGALGIVDRDSFLQQFTTTIGRRIYIPFTIGDAATLDLWSQLILCVHEHQHVVQHDQLGLRYELTYVTSKPRRARYEAEAYRSELELAAWRGRPSPNPHQLALMLSSYGVDDADRAMAARLFASWDVSIRHGAVLGEASRIAIAWLNQHLPHLQGT
jgi:hypothetical protein